MLCYSNEEVIASTHFAYPRRDGQAELAMGQIIIPVQLISTPSARTVEAVLVRMENNAELNQQTVTDSDSP